MMSSTTTNRGIAHLTLIIATAMALAVALASYLLHHPSDSLPSYTVCSKSHIDFIPQVTEVDNEPTTTQAPRFVCDSYREVKCVQWSRRRNLFNVPYRNCDEYR